MRFVHRSRRQQSAACLLTLAGSCDGASVETIRSLSDGGRLNAIQRGFHEKLGAQCGFCTPGIVMAAEGLLRTNPDPDEATVCRDGIKYLSMHRLR